MIHPEHGMTVVAAFLLFSSLLESTSHCKYLLYSDIIWGRGELSPSFRAFAEAFETVQRAIPSPAADVTA